MSKGGTSIAEAALAAALTYETVRRGIDALPDAARKLLSRNNFRNEPVTLGEGLAVAAAQALAGGHALGPIGTLSFAGAGIVGAVDDIVEPLLYKNGVEPPKGLKGHLRALAKGRVTTGNMKIAGVGIAAAALASRVGKERGKTSVVACVVDTALIAGTANLVNLFDLRPGRALKVAMVSHGLISLSQLVMPRAQGQPESAVLGAASVAIIAAAAPSDLSARGMLGDAGANSVGAALGARAVLALPPVSRAAAAAAVVALNLASERVSFTRVIDSTPLLKVVDDWGRAR